MRVTINQKEVKTGLIRKVVHYVIECKVEFSEEEKHIIKQRDLGKWHVITLPLDSMSHDPAKLEKLGITDIKWTIGMLGGKNPLTYACSTPAEAKTYAAQITDALKEMKQFIDNNADVGETSTSFEM